MLISAMAVLNPGEAAWIEDPCYQQTPRVLSLAGVKIFPKALDSQEIVIARSRKERLARIIYVTPSHHFSLGCYHDFAAQGRFARFCAYSQCIYFRGRLRRRVSLCRITTPVFARDRQRQ